MKFTQILDLRNNDVKRSNPVASQAQQEQLLLGAITIETKVARQVWFRHQWLFLHMQRTTMFYSGLAHSWVESSYLLCLTLYSMDGY